MAQAFVYLLAICTGNRLTRVWLQFTCIISFEIDSVSQVYYADDRAVQGDKEINAWWTEIQEKGHPDIKQGWPALNGVSDLVDILTTIIWVASGHHAAVNFGQYTYRSAASPTLPT